MDIRIGNDVRMILTLRGPQDYDSSNIKQLRCYLINTSKPEHCECDGKCPIPRRFPNEPFPQFYTPTPYTLHGCGKPCYHVYPYNSKRRYDAYSCGFHDYHYWDGYRGFGLVPGKFSADPGYNMPLLPCGPCDCKKKCPQAPMDFLAPYKILEEKNKIEVYFPAQDQFQAGSYKLVVTAVIWESGWGRTNLHTYTMDYGIVFDLVDEGGESGNITIDVDTNQIEGHQVVGLSMPNTTVAIWSQSILPINMPDVNNNPYRINCTLSSGIIKQYDGDPEKWPYDKLSFESSNPSILSVDERGTLIAAHVEEDTSVNVQVWNSELPATVMTFTVIVKPAIKGYIGFSTASSAAAVDLETLTAVDSVYGNKDVTNSIYGAYLWIVSPTPVTDIDGGNFDVPFESMGMLNNLYYYKSANALIECSFDITIK